jgi:hypothetical protein
MATHSNWNSPVWDQLYGPGAELQQQPAPPAVPAAQPQVPHYLSVLQQAATSSVPLNAITFSGIDHAAQSAIT